MGSYNSPPAESELKPTLLDFFDQFVIEVDRMSQLSSTIHEKLVRIKDNNPEKNEQSSNEKEIKEIKAIDLMDQLFRLLSRMSIINDGLSESGNDLYRLMG